jgi:hypothetical protein
MRAFMVSDLGLTFFDIALLSGGPKQQRVTPPFPMLSQGWPLLPAYGVELPRNVRGIAQHRLPSLWTLFAKGGVAMLEAALLSGEIQ